MYKVITLKSLNINLKYLIQFNYPLIIIVITEFSRGPYMASINISSPPYQLASLVSFGSLIKCSTLENPNIQPDKLDHSVNKLMYNNII